MGPANVSVLSARVYTRRRMIAGSAIGLCSLAMADAGAQEAMRETDKAKTIFGVRAIHQEEDFKAQPLRIYEALLDAKQFSAFTGVAGAEIHREVGGTFTIFAGHIIGLNVEMVPNRRIVQAWRAVTWPEGIYSIARFELVARDSGTRVVFDHTGFPSELAEHLESGWREHYWGPLQKYLG